MTKAEDAERGGVTLINGTRQSLVFQVPARAVHLLPGQSVVVPEAYLETLEVKRLCQEGALIRVASPEAHPASSEETHGGRTERGRSRTGRSKQS